MRSRCSCLKPFRDDRGAFRGYGPARQAWSALWLGGSLLSSANMIYADEQVVQLGQGLLDKKQGIVVLTNERLFFFEKSGLLGESLVQFDVGAIQALSVAKGWGGERLEVAHAGMKTEIKQMGPGQADGRSRRFERLKRAPASPPPPVSPAAAAAPAQDRTL